MATCKACGGRGGWYEPDEGTWVTCVACNGSGKVEAKRKPRAKPFESVAVRLSDNGECVLNVHTTARAALNSMCFVSAFGPAGYSYRVRDSRTGEWAAEQTLSR